MAHVRSAPRAFRPREGTGLLAVAFVCALVAGGCGSAGQSGSAATTTVARSPAGTSASTAPKFTDTTLGTGVTATTVKLGIVMVDFGCVSQFVDTVRNEQQATYQVFVDDINAHGGIAGRKVVPVYKSYCPIQSSEALATCTALAEDDKVFAAVGTLFDTSGDAQLCFAKQHDTPLITHGLSEAVIAKAKPGLLITPDITAERQLRVVMSLLKTEGTFRGKTVAVLAEQGAQSEITSTIDPGLDALGVKRGTDAILTITGADTTAAQSQLDSFIERWKTEHVDALVLAGSEVSSKQFVQKVKAAFPDMTLVADTTSFLSSAQDLQRAGVKPNPYDGMITAEGQTGSAHFAGPHGVYCRTIWERSTGRKMPGPLVVIPAKGNKRDDLYGEIEDSCAEVTMFRTIATRVGQYLNATNWALTVDNFGKIDDTSTIYASLHRGKYDADDTYGLVAYDPSIGKTGDWRRVTPVRDVGNA